MCLNIINFHKNSSKQGTYLIMLPVIDIFAGPGGLGEGFAQAGFDVRLSVEMDPTACKTLTLRKFFNQFTPDQIPTEYYSFVRGEINQSELEQLYPIEWEKAVSAVANIELGTERGNSELYERLDKLVSPSEDFILIGGPPCQAYSLAGRSRMLGAGVGKFNLSSEEKNQLEIRLASDFYSDKRHTLYLEYLKILYRYQPAVFIMENVKGLSSAKVGKDADRGSVFDNICNGLRRGIGEETVISRGGGLAQKGYKLFSMNPERTEEEIENSTECILKSEDFGIPQTRHRLIIVGIREDIQKIPEPLVPNEKTYTVQDAISDLPRLRSGLSKEKDDAKLWKEVLVSQIREYLINETSFDSELKEIYSRLMGENATLTRGASFVESKDEFDQTNSNEFKSVLSDKKIGGFIQHETRSHIRRDLLRYFLVSSYGTIFGKSPRLSDWEGRLNELRPNHSNVEATAQNLLTVAHNDRFKVQVWNKPSSTVVSHISKDGHYFIHPDPTQCRSLTVREAARLQTFPDNYYFCGNRTQQYHQVGNAVPVLLAKQIALSISKMFRL